MALSNKFGWLVLTTGNKSEMSVGYATLYGDMAGGFAVLKDVLKGWVYRLARWRNRDREVIPQRIIDKPPTAELRENQLDTDSLPPYDTLDAVLEAYVEEDRSPEDIAEAGHDPDLVDRIVAMVDLAEYKRRQPRRGCASPSARSDATAGCRSPTGTGRPDGAVAGFHDVSIAAAVPTRIEPAEPGNGSNVTV